MGRVAQQTIEILTKMISINPQELQGKNPEQVEAEVSEKLQKYLVKNDSERDQAWAMIRSQVETIIPLCEKQFRLGPPQPGTYQLSEKDIHAITSCLHLVRLELTHRVMMGISSQMEGV